MRFLALIALAACAYQPPIDEMASAPNGVSGKILYDGDVEPSYVVVYLTDASNPMPPYGTGRPITFSSVSSHDFVGELGSVQSADFTFTNVPDGTYVVTALMDMDKNFHPQASGLAGSTCMDVVGGIPGDLAGTTLGSVTVSGGVQADGLSVALLNTVPIQRPVFTTQDGMDEIVIAEIGQGGIPVGIFGLESDAFVTEYGPDNGVNFTGPFDPSAIDPCDTAFWLEYVDADGDGNVDPHPDFPPELGIPDVWPRVVLTYLGVPSADGDSYDPSALPEGESWASVGLPYFLEGLNPATVPPVNTPTPITAMSVGWAPSALRTNPDGTQDSISDPTQIPTGAWQITVIAKTGQTWSIPNELDKNNQFSALIPPPGVTSNSQPAQGNFLSIQ